MKPGASAGRIPEKVSDAARASVTAGFANEVDDVNQYAAVMKAATANGVAVYDDFAHHPTAIATTVDGLRRAEPGGRILAVLEPRSNTMKLGTMKAALPRSLAQADCVFCYTAGLGWNAAEALAPLGTRAEIHEDLGALVAAVVAAARSGDHILVMSNGGFGGVHQRLLDALAAA